MFTTLNSYKASLIRRLAAIRDWNIVLPAGSALVTGTFCGMFAGYPL